MTLAPQITFRNMATSPELEREILKEADRLERFFPRIVSCRVAMEAPKPGKPGGMYRVRIDLGVPGEELVVDHVPTLHATLQAREAIRTTKASEPHRERCDPARAIHEAFRGMRRRLQSHVRRVAGQTKQHETRLEGLVARIWPEEGYGFIQANDREVYFHRNSVLAGQFERLRPASRVHFTEDMGEKGPQATSVTLMRTVREGRNAASTVLVPRRRTGRI